MFGSLRFRLPALFLLGIVLAGLVAALISIRFFQNYTRARAIDELRSESVGIVQLYARQGGLETVPYTRLVRALGGDSIYWVPAFRGATLYQGCLSSRRPRSTSTRSTGAARRRSTSSGMGRNTSPSHGRSSSAPSSSVHWSLRSRRRNYAAA